MCAGSPAAQYQEAFDDLLGGGFRPTGIAGYGVDGKAEHAAVWKQTGGPDWQARHGLTSGEYQQAFDQLVRRGYRLRRVSGYFTSRSVLYAAIWEQSGGPVWEARHWNAWWHKNTHRNSFEPDDLTSASPGVWERATP